jgi:hypothetical protein
MAFKVGSATIDRVEEQRVRMPIGLFTDDVDLFPAHFAEPHHGRAVAMSGGFAFVAGGTEA